MANEPHIDPDQQFEALLANTLPAVSQADEAHYELPELTRLADARRTQGEAWEMPAHLARCGLCLEAFQALLEGVSKLSAGTLERFVGVGKNGEQAPANVVAFPSAWKMFFKIAAVAVVLLVAAGLVVHLNGRTSAQVSGGTVVLQDGQLLPRGAAIPGSVTVTATEETRASLADGSQVELAKDTQVIFRESLAGNTTITLTSGKVLATVAKQKPGKEFVVKTPFGSVVVVGTRFSVTCQAEDVVVYQSGAGEAGTKQRTDVVRAMRVAVFEGVVRVKRAGEQVSVTAGQTAAVREGEPGIEVLGARQ